jgi:hypothetical protein
MKHFTLFTCLLAFLFISCGGDDESEPLTLDDIEQVEPQTEPAVVDAVDKAIREAVALSIKLDDHGIPHIVTHQPKINPEEADIPLPELVINIDDVIDDALMNDTEELDRKLGDPISVVEFDRYYHLFDGNVAQFHTHDMIVNAVVVSIIDIRIYYRRGYPTSMEAVKAAGFAENEVTLKKPLPVKVIGVKPLAQDTYSAETENHVYEHISVVEDSNDHVWYIVMIGPIIIREGQ